MTNTQSEQELSVNLSEKRAKHSFRIRSTGYESVLDVVYTDHEE